MNDGRYRTLLVAASEYLSWLRRKRRPVLMVPAGRFFSELVWATRPHFFALPMFAALAGVAGSGKSLSSLRCVLAVVAAGLGWGVVQLLNDLLDRDTDAVMANDRAIVSGRLPAGPTLFIAALAALFLIAATIAIHPEAWTLAAAATFLVIVYNAAKSYPVAGNVAHGALMAVAAAIGCAAGLSEDSRGGAFAARLGGSWRLFAMVAAVAAFYLQSNYEKDRAGDRVAGYRTLAVVVGVRASAIVRAVAITAIAVGAALLDLLRAGASLTMLVALLLGLLSTMRPIVRATDAAALSAYRLAVHASMLAMMSLGMWALGSFGSLEAALVALSLTEWAFKRSDNP